MRSNPNFLFRLLDKDYHESLNAYVPRKADFYDQVCSKLPSGWQISRQGIWFHCGCPQNIVPQQGWKIHVSATPCNASEVLERVTSVLVQSCDADFKFVLDMSLLFLVNSKNWSRGGSGKFLTIYPSDSNHFLDLIEKIHQATKGLQGPYILSDHRYTNSGVVYYRYGGMRRYDVLNVEGERVPMLVGPDGSEIPDERLAYPVTPSWASELLSVDKPHQPSEDAHTLNHGRYRVEDVFDFSNAGGVYKAIDEQTGQQVVIKEARPHVNSTPDGYDAVAMLKKEYRLLSMIQDEGIAPKPIELFQEWEHWFLVEEHIEGTPLGTHSAMNNVLLRTRPERQDYEEWYESFRALSLNLIRIVNVLHSRNIVFADLSPNNLIVLPGGTSLKIIDFEGAYEIGIDGASGIFTPGFISDNRLAGGSAAMEDDYYAMGAVLMSYLFPVNSLFHLKPRAKQEIMSSIQDDAHLPGPVANMVLGLMNGDPAQRPRSAEILDVLECHRTLAPGPQRAEKPVPDDHDYHDLLQGIVTHLQDAANYNRHDRLYPSDPKLFATNPLSIAYGAAGAGYALYKVTGESQQATVDWIMRHKITPETYSPGLYVGTSGIAWGLLEMGARDQAEEVFRQASQHHLLHQSPDIFHGSAGWGMACLKFFMETGNEFYLEAARQAGNVLLGSRQESEYGCYWESTQELRLGLAHGSAGIALFFLYLYLATGEENFLAAGQQALDFDLSFAIETKDGGLSWPESVQGQSPVYPYWRFGSAGMGQVVLRYNKLLANDSYRFILEKIFVDTDRKYAVFPGLFNGLTGLGDFLLGMYEFSGENRFLEAAARVAQGIMMFRVERRGTAFPGDSLSRLSCDYGTGSAGIALFLNRLLGRQKSDFMLDPLFTMSNKSQEQLPHHISDFLNLQADRQGHVLGD